MIRDGEPDVTLSYLAAHGWRLAIGHFTDGTCKQCPLEVKHCLENLLDVELMNHGNQFSNRGGTFAITSIFLMSALSLIEKPTWTL
jgi:hypothetical protein